MRPAAGAIPSIRRRTPLASASSSGTRFTRNLVCGHVDASGHAAQGHEGADGNASAAGLSLQTSWGVWLLRMSLRTVEASTATPSASVFGIQTTDSVGGRRAKRVPGARRIRAGSTVSSAVHGTVGSASRSDCVDSRPPLSRRLSLAPTVPAPLTPDTWLGGCWPRRGC